MTSKRKLVGKIHGMDIYRFVCPVCKEEIGFTGVGQGTHNFYATHYYLHELEKKVKK